MSDDEFEDLLSDQEGEFFDEKEEDAELDAEPESRDGKTQEELEKQRASRKEQKQKALERKLQKPHSDIILEAKKIWEELRQKRLTKPERKKLMDQMMEIVTGKALDIIYKHDASRIVQCCIKYGSPAQRDLVAEELSGHYAKLSQSKYGRFIVSKILQYCSPKYRNAVITDFHGKVRKLIRHKEASLLLDEAYSQYANAAQRNSLMEEFYGPEFAIFKTTDGPRSLQELIKSQPLKKQYILKHTRAAIDSVLEKASFNVGKTPILHRAIFDYVTVADPAACKDLIELLKDHLVHMLHTREGARIAQYCLLHAGPKDRKHIVKSFKGFVHSIAKEQYGHAVLLSCFECIDDTVLVGKAIIGELFAPPTPDHLVSELLRDQYGSRVLLFLLCGRNKRYQPSYVVAELEATDAVRAETTKKEPEARHSQLLEIASPLLIKEVALAADELLRDKAGSTVLVETCNNAVGDISPVTDAVLESLSRSASGELSTPQPADEVVNVVKKLKAERDALKKKEQGLNMNESILVARSGTFAIKLLLAKPKDAELAWKADFGKKVWAVLAPHFVKLVKHSAEHQATSSGLAFIFIALFENGDAHLQKEMKSAIKKDLASIVAKVDTGKPAADSEKKRKRDGPHQSGMDILVKLLQ
ncbi:hypothetical protein HDU91_004954 [Kappamyces sp. JEL0680]|nr:hypothetical protein HDU91_004954 [Kappamyces sp. JEL0680]